MPDSYLALAQQAVEALNRPDYLSAGVALVVGLLQCGVVVWGIMVMQRATKASQNRHDETMRVLTTNHEENMTALKTLIERTARG